MCFIRLNGRLVSAVLFVTLSNLATCQEQLKPSPLRSRASDVIAKSIQTQPPSVQADAFQKLMFGRDPLTGATWLGETGQVGQLNKKIIKNEMELLELDHVRREQKRRLAGAFHKIDTLILEQVTREIEFEISEADRLLNQKKAALRLERFENRCKLYCDSMFKLTGLVKSGEAHNTLLDKLSDRALYYELQDMASISSIENSYLLAEADLRQIIVKTPNFGTGSRTYSLIESQDGVALTWPFLLRQPEFKSKCEPFEREWISFQERRHSLTDDELKSLIHRYQQLVDAFRGKYDVTAMQNESTTNIKLYLMAESFLKNLDRELSTCMLSDLESR